ncbi:MAG: DUF2281 domain-containing protein [Leptolyngbyaceae bacterium]|nr:DUF2281 domain-containing protein [Leptolyngbyaceae bacterium]
MTIAEQIYALVKTLPQDQAGEILTFAELVCAKHLNTPQPMRESVPNVTLSASFKASLRHLHNLTQDFPSMDPVALVWAGREELDERGCF